MSLFHRHHWVAVAAQKLYYKTARFGVPIEGTESPITEVLLKCECGDVRTKMVDGHWTIEDINPSLKSQTGWEAE